MPAFRRPESKNAAHDARVRWRSILGTLFFGVSVLAHHLHPYPSHDDTVFAQMGQQVFGDNVVFWVLQLATAGILTLAANTAYADFPRLSSIIARDGYLPAPAREPRRPARVLQRRRSCSPVAAALLIVAFGGVTNALIPLYAVGVFLSFTLSQTGMVRHHLKEREPHWQRGVAINGVGAVATAIVTLIVATTKFTERRVGAARRDPDDRAAVQVDQAALHERSPSALRVPTDYKPRRMNHTVVVLVGSVHRGVLEALAYAKSLAPNHLVAVTIVSDEEEQERIETAWSERQHRRPARDRALALPGARRAPIMRFIDELDARYENDIITVVLPEFVVTSWWGHLLHNQSALFLKGRLLFRKGTVVTSVPYHLDGPIGRAGARRATSRSTARST